MYANKQIYLCDMMWTNQYLRRSIYSFTSFIYSFLLLAKLQLYHSACLINQINCLIRKLTT
jgi:hypothetical protein